MAIRSPANFFALTAKSQKRRSQIFRAAIQPNDVEVIVSSFSHPNTQTLRSDLFTTMGSQNI
jgi:hypothetical protein